MPDNFEIAFSFDTTGSMYRCLEEVRKKLGDIVRELKSKIPGIRIAIFAHGDYCDEGSTYVTKYINFTSDASSLCKFVQNVEATHGGDAPECYELVMREVQEKLSWSANSQKALVMIGDALPHDKSEKQNYRHLDWKEETERLRDRITSTTSMTFTYTPVAPVKPPSSVPSFGPPIMFDDHDDDSDYDSEDNAGLKCTKCKVFKLPNEFPPSLVTDNCNHYIGVCLRCVVQYVKKNGHCPQDGCEEVVDSECDNIKLFQAYLDHMFVDYGKILAESRGGSEDDISVSTMNGDTAWIQYNPNMTIIQLKGEVRKQLGIPDNQQKLLFNEQTLKTSGGARLSTYNIQKNSSISVIVPLFCIPENLDHVVFDLSWEFPKTNPDFLDASCFAFNRTEFIQVIDWNHPTNDFYLKGAIKHTAENIKSAGGRVGHQKIEVFIKRLPSDVTHVYFTLSSWRSPNLSAFSNPSLQFYEASEPGANLCSTTFGHALNSQAVVICYLTRVGKEWQIKECDSNGCVDGNAKRYNPIRKKIVELIKDDMDS